MFVGTGVWKARNLGIPGECLSNVHFGIDYLANPSAYSLGAVSYTHLDVYKRQGFQERVCQILIMMMAEACREFEKLPIIKYADILRNILYSGVWCRFEAVSEQRKKKQEKEHV